MLAAESHRSSSLRVAGQHALVVLHDVVQDRAADLHLVAAAAALRSRRTVGTNWSVSRSSSITQPRSASTHSKISSMIRCSNWSMSSVWLAASAVWYMTSRLLRARASQGLSEADSGPKIWLPACWPSELTIREPARQLILGDDIDAVGQHRANPARHPR